MPFCFAQSYDEYREECLEALKEKTGNYTDWIIANPLE